jgi:hypothetical protein
MRPPRGAHSPVSNSEIRSRGALEAAKLVAEQLKKNANTYSNIQGASPLPKGMMAPEIVNEKPSLDINDIPYADIEKLPLKDVLQ